MVNPNRFYTYAYLRVDRTPYYIGKGQGDRAYYKRKRRVKPPKDKSRIIILKQNLTEDEAFRHEKYMIAVFGRKDLGTGILHNITDGGEGSSGAVRSEEYKSKKSKMMKGRYVGENNPFYNKTHSKKTKTKISKSKKGKTIGKKWWNDGNGSTKMSIECPGEGWVLGRSEESKQKMSKSKRKSAFKPPSPKNKKWWNDGKENTKMSEECPGEGWFPGRGKSKDTSQTDY